MGLEQINSNSLDETASSHGITNAALEQWSRSPAVKLQHAIKQEDDANKTFIEREFEVVGKGFAYGMADAGRNSFRDLGNASQQFADNPLSFTGNFLKDHWHEAAIGAAIAIASPRKWVNAALLAYSMRGVAETTATAAVDAADSKANLPALRQSFQSQIATEGSAFINSLPMTVLGSTIGRSGANAVFGKNKGAYDLMTGDVSLAQVKRNLWHLHDTVRPPEVKLVVTDMDNTLYSFSRYLAPGIRDGIKELSVKTGIGEEALYKSIGKAMDQHHSFNYPWSIEVALAERLNVGKPGGMTYEQFRTNLSDPFWRTIDRNLEQYGGAFPQILPTLQELRARNVPVAVLSNASHSVGMKRLSVMGLNRGKLVDRMYVVENPPEPTGIAADLINHGRDRLKVGQAIETDLAGVRVLPKAWEKPDVRGMNEILETYNLRPRQVLMVGDSVKNDIVLALETDTRGLLVRYPFTNPELEGVLRRLSSKPKMEKAKMGEELPRNRDNIAEAADFSGVLQHLQPKPNYGLMIRNTAAALAVRPRLSSIIAAQGLEPRENQ